MGTTATTHYGFLKPNLFEETDTWGAILNSTFDAIDASLFSGLANKLNLTGGTLSGSLSISNTNPIINLTAAASGQSRLLNFNTGINRRWSITANLAAESGSNAGSNFSIDRFDDAGAMISNAFTIERSTGNAAIDGALNINGALTSVKTSGTNQVIVSSAGSAVRGMKIQTLGVDRWQFRTAISETGSDAGSNLILSAYNDAGSILRDSFTINRKTGATEFVGSFFQVSGDFYVTGLSNFGDLVANNETIYSTLTVNSIAGAAIGTNVQAWNTNLDAVADLSNGIPARVSSGSWAARAINGTAGQITVTNGNGVSGNPVLSLPSAIAFPGTADAGTFDAAGATNGKSISANVIDSSRNNTSSLSHLRFYNPNGLVGSISTSASATTYATTSDARLKTDLRSFDSGEIVDSIKVYDFKWIKGGGRSHGVMAQELIKIIPYAVNEGITHDGEIIEPMGVDYSKLVPVLLQEIKSLRNRIDKLEKK